MIRLIPTRDSEPVDAKELHGINELIQARIDGRISRRALMRRGAELGMSTALVGVMLHATSDYAFGKPSNGRNAALRALHQDGAPAQITGPTQPAGAQVTGGTITAGTISEPDTIHPWVSQLVTGADVYCAIVEPLMEYDSNQQQIPLLAESYEISEDGLIYTFKLRQGVTFHNGAPFTAQDVIESWKMIMNPDFGAFTTVGWDKITDISAPDDFTVVMTTSEIFAPFLSYLGDNGSNICPKDEIAKGIDSFKQVFGRAPIGTGPFTFVEWRAKELIDLAANPQYWGGKPIVDRVIYRVVADDNTQLVQLETGEIQVSASDGAIGALRVDEVLGFDNVTVYEHAGPNWSHLDLKHIDFLRMTKVRQALDFATPTQLIIDQLLKGRALPSVADQTPGTWAYNPDIQPRPYDLEQAKTLLTEAGLTLQDGVWTGPTPAPDSTDPNAQPATGPVKPFEMELWGLAGDTQTQQICQVIAQSWNELGVKTEAKFEDISTIWGPEGYQFTDKMTACLYSWYNSNDPDDYIYWHSSQIPSTPTGSGYNLPAYFFPYNFQAEIDDLTARAGKETDQEARRQLYFQVQELLHEEVPVIFMYWSTQYPVVANNIGGVWPSAFNRLLWNAEKWYLTE